jgi:hypothetical protein
MIKHVQRFFANRTIAGMRTLRASVFAVTSFAVLAVSIGCSKSDAPSSGGGAAATTAVSSATTTSALLPTTYNKAQFPAKGTRPVTTTAKRGGSGPTRPSNLSKKLSERGTDRESRTPATVDMVDCNAAVDNAAECDGDKMFYCDDQQLWQVDCNAEAQHGGVASGGCFEAETFTECLGCDVTADGSQACCDFEMTVCCDKDGSCYSPK